MSFTVKSLKYEGNYQNQFLKVPIGHAWKNQIKC